jgi:hypothetical protein
MAHPGDFMEDASPPIWSSHSTGRLAPAAGSDRREGPVDRSCDPAAALTGLESASGDQTDPQLVGASDRAVDAHARNS